MRTYPGLAASFALLLALAPACGSSSGGDDDNVNCTGAQIGTADGCCPDGANANTDEDCSPVCGNDVMESGEECDDGNTTPGDGCDAVCALEPLPTAYRLDTLNLRDPHLFAFGSIDVTDTVNGQIATAVTTDGDSPPDGLLDLSLVLVFRPVSPSSASSSGDAVISADCTAPVETTSCSVGADSNDVAVTATNADNSCLQPIDGTTSGYSPAVTTPGGRCFSTEPEDITVTAAGVSLVLHGVKIAAAYDGQDPPASFTDGLFYGFMTQADADATTLPADLPVVGGQPLSSLLKAEDQDTGPAGETGWYFYFNYTATEVAFTE